MCDMNFQWYSLHPSISSSTSRSTAPRLRPVSVGKHQSRGSSRHPSSVNICPKLVRRHQRPESRPSLFTPRIPSFGIVASKGTRRVQRVFGLDAVPIVTLTCDEMNYIVDCFVRCSRCVTSKLEDVQIFASSQSHAKLPFGTAVIGRFSIVPKSVSTRTDQDGFFDFRGMYPAKTIRLFPKVTTTSMLRLTRR